MQITLTIPDEIPQETVNKLLIQIDKRIQAAKKRALNSSKVVDIKSKARQDLTQMVTKLRNSAEELGFVSEEEISQWVNEAREKHAGHY